MFLDNLKRFIEFQGNRSMVEVTSGFSCVFVCVISAGST